LNGPWQMEAGSRIRFGNCWSWFSFTWKYWSCEQGTFWLCGRGIIGGVWWLLRRLLLNIF